MKDDDVDAGMIFLMILMTTMSRMIGSKSNKNDGNDDDEDVIDDDDNNNSDGGKDHGRGRRIDRETIVKILVNICFEDGGADDDERDEMIDNDPDGR